ncbi:hypothetical protein A9267_09820 [Shewanella sp. UCD-FRSSP16_17]|uniref:hypothetical protein n=1 Tax=Shewanella sp. UCD-FRSSP16_17 TaxID=1853256 RepID=UPI0007EEC47E|nr:hypothetical protein [Shewanella sp. UCD-FRSSP16_17]OBT09275.1 hypothetical protein A9267_09820 [Shewanella sp. UCD-FRSSP16_17]
MKRHSPKRARNALYESQLKSQHISPMLHRQTKPALNEHINNQQLLNSHYNALQQHIKLLTHEITASKSLSIKFSFYSPIINRKMKTLDSKLYTTLAEFKVVTDLIDEIRKESQSPTANV